MAYTKTDWVSGETPLSAQNMNKMERGIEDAHNDISELNSKTSTTLATSIYIERCGKGRVLNFSNADAVNTANITLSTTDRPNVTKHAPCMYWDGSKFLTGIVRANVSGKVIVLNMYGSETTSVTGVYGQINWYVD